MTTIDHRILIPAAPDVVWEYVSDITHNPDWQIDCQEVIFLTSRREGPGLRWRYSAPNNHEYVIAVTAWYNGLGYEYYFVDGVSYRENKGRIRLQEIPEGTIVQWTFTYELGGLLGGMRNTLGVSRQVDHTISESLKTLWQKVKQSGAASRPHEAKSLMRDAPDVGARSAYQPRHPSPVTDHPEGQPQPLLRPALAKIEAEPPISEGDGQPIHVIAEPPVAEDDTRPRRAVEPVSEVASVPPDIEGEPEFLDRMVDLSRFEPPRSPSDTKPVKPITPAEEAAPQIAAQTPLKGEETEPLGFPLPETLPGYSHPALEEQPTAPAPGVGDETLLDLGTLTPVEPPTTTEEKILILDHVEPEPEPLAPPIIDRIEPLAPIVTEEKSPLAEPVEQTPLAPAAPVEAEPASPPALAPEPKVASEAASIWEIFGVPRPSETQQTAAVSAALPAQAPEPEAAPESESTLPDKVYLVTATASSRVGLRVALRRKLVHVRRP